MREKGRGTALLLGLTLWGAGLYLRLPILAVPPLIPSIHADLALNEAATGALTTLPALVFAVMAVPGSFLIARWGARRTLFWGLVLCSLAGAARGAVVAPWWLFLMTLVMGMGIAVMQPALPSLVRRWWPEHVGFGTAVYSNGLLSGELIAAGTTLPWLLPLLHGSWRGAFVAWEVPTLLVLALIAFHGRREERPTGRSGPLELRHWWPDWRDGRGWLIAFILGAISGTYLGTNSLLPDYLQSTGASGTLAAALASLNGTQLLASAISLAFANRLMGRRLPFILLGFGGCLAVAGLIATPAVLAPLWCGLLGFCTSLMLVLTLALPALIVGSIDTHRLSSMMFTIGYAMAFIIPLLSGALWDATGLALMGFVPALILMGLIGPMALALHFGAAE